MLVQNVIMYVFIVVFIVPISNFHMSSHETSSFTFLEWIQRPYGLKIPKMPQIGQNGTFYLLTFHPSFRSL